MLKKFILKPILYLLVGLFIIFEEYVWNLIFKYIYLKIKELKIMDKFKAYLLKEKSEYKLLLIFLIPFVLMEGMSLYAMSLIGSGLIVIGVIVYIFKILLTIPVVIIFNTVKKKLLSFKIIYVVYSWILKMKRSNLYRKVKEFAKNLKANMKIKMEQVKKFIQKEIYIIKNSYFKNKGNDLSLKELIKAVYKDLKENNKG